MERTEDLLTKAEAVRSIEELIDLAKANNIDLTEEQAQAYIKKLYRTKELADSELDSVAGGCFDDEVRPPRPEKADISSDTRLCPYCSGKLHFCGSRQKSEDDYDIYLCWNESCKKSFRHYFEGDEWTVN